MDMGAPPFRRAWCYSRSGLVHLFAHACARRTCMRGHHRHTVSAPSWTSCGALRSAAGLRAMRASVRALPCDVRRDHSRVCACVCVCVHLAGICGAWRSKLARVRSAWAVETAESGGVESGEPLVAERLYGSAEAQAWARGRQARVARSRWMRRIMTDECGHADRSNRPVTCELGWDRPRRVLVYPCRYMYPPRCRSGTRQRSGRAGV